MVNENSPDTFVGVSALAQRRSMMDRQACLERPGWRQTLLSHVPLSGRTARRARSPRANLLRLVPRTGRPRRRSGSRCPAIEHRIWRQRSAITLLKPMPIPSRSSGPIPLIKFIPPSQFCVNRLNIRTLYFIHEINFTPGYILKNYNNHLDMIYQLSYDHN